MKKNPIISLICLLMLISACAPADVTGQTTPTANIPATAAPTETFKAYNLDTISAPSLENNLVGEPTKRDISFICRHHTATRTSDSLPSIICLATAIAA